MNWVWFGLMAVSLVFGICSGRGAEVSRAAVAGAGEAVSLFLVLLAAICLWNGLMKIADEAGITRLMQRALLPLTSRLFRDLKPGSPGMKAISMNIAANFLGLGNAATPFGLQAMAEMKKQNGNADTASNSMAMFVVVNTASLQLIPTTVAAIRVRCDSPAPFSTLPAMWLASAVTLCFGVLVTRLFERFSPAPPGPRAGSSHPATGRRKPGRNPRAGKKIR